MKTTCRDMVASSIRHSRMIDRLEAYGIESTFRDNLDRMSNVRMSHGGTRLQDATCHYTFRHELSGNTYGIKDVLKARGYRWDAARKCWWLAANEADTHRLYAELCRLLATQ